MLLRLLLLFTVVPFVELLLLLKIAERFDWLPTLALVIGTGVLGAWLARREGFKAFGRIQADLAAGAVPTAAMVDGLLILLAGVVLVTPGILTDLCGFALLIPPIRRWIRKRLAEAFKKRIVVIHRGGSEPFPSRPDPFPGGQDPFIDVPAKGRDVDEAASPRDVDEPAGRKRLSDD